MPSVRLLLLPVIVASALVLAGCGNGVQRQTYALHKKLAFKVGDQWVIEPPHEINATRVAMTRRVIAAADAAGGNRAEPQPQKLSIDLTNGRAVFEDSDGRAYPQQIDMNVVRRIHGYLADRSWQVGRLPAHRAAQEIHTYHLAIYEMTDKVQSEAVWSVPPRQPLPEVLELLSNTFDVAYRYAHPLSREVNLLD